MKIDIIYSTEIKLVLKNVCEVCITENDMCKSLIVRCYKVLLAMKKCVIIFKRFLYSCLFEIELKAIWINHEWRHAKSWHRKRVGHL